MKNSQTFPNLVKNKTNMLQFHFLKYLKYSDLINLKYTCKDAGYFFDSNVNKSH